MLQSMNTDWATCYGDLRGQYDPPIALTPVSQVAVPTISQNGPISTPASPASTLRPATATPTTTAAASDSDPSLNPNESATTTRSSLSSTPTTDPQSQQNSETRASSSIANGEPVSGGNTPTTPDLSTSAASASSSADPTSADPGAILASILAGAQSSSLQSQSSSANSQSQQDLVTATPSSPGSDPSTSTRSTSLPSDDPASTDPGAILASILGGAQSSSPHVQSSAANSQSQQDPATARSTSSGSNPPASVGAVTLPSNDPASTDPGAVLASILGGAAGSSLPSVQFSTTDLQSHTASDGSASGLPNGDPSVSTGSALAPSADPTGTVMTTVKPGATPAPVSGEADPQFSNSPKATASSPVADPEQASAMTASFPISPLATVGGQTIAVDPQSPSNVIVGGTLTLQAGEGISVGSNTVSLGPNGLVVGGSSTAPLPLAQAQQTAATTYPVNSQVVTAKTGDTVTIGSDVLTVGGSAATQNGNTVSAATNGIVIGDSTIAYTAPTSSVVQSVAVFTIGSQAYTATAKQPIVIGSTTLTAGSALATPFGTTISIANSGIVVDGSTISFTKPASNQPPSLGPEASPTTLGSPFTAYAVASTSGVYIINSGSDTIQTISADGPAATISGQTFSAGHSGVIVDGSSTIQVQTVSASLANAATFTIDGHTHTAIQDPGSSVAVIDGSATLTADGPGTSLDGQSITLATGGLVVDGTTESWSTATVLANGSGGIPGGKTGTTATTTSASSKSTSAGSSSHTSAAQTGSACTLWIPVHLLLVAIAGTLCMV